MTFRFSILKISISEKKKKEDKNNITLFLHGKFPNKFKKKQEL